MRCEVVTGGVSGLAQGETYLMTVSHIDKVLIYGQGLGTRCKRGCVMRLKPGRDPIDQLLQPSLMTTQDILEARELTTDSTEPVYHAGVLGKARLTLDRIALTAGCGIGHPAFPQATGDWGQLVDVRTAVNDARAGTIFE